MKLVEACGMGDVGEDDRRAVDKPARRNRTGQRVLDRSVRDSGTHALLPTPGICRFRLLCRSGASKKRQTDGSDHDETGNQVGMKRKSAGNQCWHETPTVPSSMRNLLTQPADDR